MMKTHLKLLIPLAILLFLCLTMTFAVKKEPINSSGFVSYTVSPKDQHIEFFFKKDNDQLISSLNNLRKLVNSNGQELLFATNGGMYDSIQLPVGLFIQDFRTIVPLNTLNGVGNFYLKPNGVFYITANNEAQILATSDFINNDSIKYATQSGPMLVIDGQIHPAFKQGSANVNVRNGVGILPDGQIVFVMSRSKINFYDFASYFLVLGCENALYLDGYVSRTYLPEQNCMQLDGKFGVIIGVIK